MPPPKVSGNKCFIAQKNPPACHFLVSAGGFFYFRCVMFDNYLAMYVILFIT